MLTFFFYISVSGLQKMGTYAGNDAIVAFARLHQVNIIIHQLSSPFLLVSLEYNIDDTQAAVPFY